MSKPDTSGSAGSMGSGGGGGSRRSGGDIESILLENRRFHPPPERIGGRADAIGRWLVASMDEYRREHRRSIERPEEYWGEVGRQSRWFTPYRRVLEWNAPDAKWFVGGTTNLCFNCVDRHVEEGHGHETAIMWESEPYGADGQPEIRRLSYADVQAETCRLGNALKSLGVSRGDVVTIYMGMVPELAIAMLACARIGAAHSVIFGGFSAHSIADRMTDAKSRVVITCDGAWRRGKIVPLKEHVDAAAKQLQEAGLPIRSTIVLKRIDNPVAWTDNRDHWYSELTARQDATPRSCPCEAMDSEAMLFLLYTSGSTGKPKGILHSTGGYMVYTAHTARLTFNLEPGRGQVFWCTADCGWITGHSYIVYGIMQNRVPTFMYEGAPNAPSEDRFWRIAARHKVTQFYTAPTAIRTFMKWGEQHPRGHDLSSIRVLGTVGEPINPEAWMWYQREIGGGVLTTSPDGGVPKTPIVDTYWQTETGGHVITPLPGCTPGVPGSCTLPFFGIDAAVTDEHGRELEADQGGLLVIRKPWPGMLRGVYGDRARFIDTYWSRVKTAVGEPFYCAGDAARRDRDGNFWIMGRIDDVINVSGHRLGTMEVESALVSSGAVVEAAVVGVPHEIKGTGIAAFCTLSPDAAARARGGGEAALDMLRERLREHVSTEIGAIAKPDMIRFTPLLPKTRSGKIMRRLLRDIAAGVENTKQDVTTLEDFSVLAKLRGDEE